MRLLDLQTNGLAIGLASRLDSAKAINITKDLSNFLLEKKIKAFPESRIANILGLPGKSLHEMTADQVPAIACVGGDGTILRVAQKLPFKNPPAILGVNVGAVGFLAEFDVNTRESFNHLVSANLIEERCIRLSCHVDAQDHFPPALNEILVITSRPSKALSITVSVDKQVFSTGYVDGVIVSTPTGSTAYSLSAGGALVAPELEAVQLVPVSPFVRTGFKPLLLPSSSTIEIELLRPKLNAIVAIDGQNEYTINSAVTKRITIRKSPSGISFLRTQASKTSFFSRLNKKLLPGAKFPLPKHDQPEE
ncbi:MAG: NAD(+)/NADH kinase [Candidatus Lokiarchaeota archaeon]|nr:NAD(+)/NADH kinase [Candidatus Lokiarchaeota archaeon]